MEVKSMIRFNGLAKLISILCIVFAVSIVAETASHAQQDIRLSKGQTVYVPVYSHIYFGDKETPFYLAATISIRNIDQAGAIAITEVNYYDTNGRLIKKYLEKPIQLGANASTRFVIKESDDKGGSGANFIVRWRSDIQVNAPIVESIMIGTRNQQGVSFTSRGQVIGDGSR
jgi:cytochrome c biogenesis factor